MIAKYNRISIAIGLPGILMQIGGRVMMMNASTESETLLPALLAFVGTGLLLVGLAFYAKAKGRHPAWCLFAFLSLIGLIVLACLKDHAPNK